MNRTFLLSFALSIIAAPVLAQEEALKQASNATTSGFSAADTSGKVWTRGAQINLNFTQVKLVNWAAGGNSSVAGIALFNGYANKHKGRIVWDNTLSAAFGGILNEGQDPLKTDDRLQLTSKWGYELKKPWYFAALADFRTQFTEGFDAASGTRISNLFAPAYLTLALGFDYKPNDKFSAFLSPAAARITFVNDETLADAGAFGVDPAEYDLTTGDLIKRGSNTRFELGAYARAMYKSDFGKKVSFMTRLELFSNYLEEPQNVDVIWETLTTFKATEWLGITLNTLLIYDHDVLILKTNDAGVPYTGPDTQFKETLGIGLTFKL